MYHAHEKGIWRAQSLKMTSLMTLRSAVWSQNFGRYTVDSRNYFCIKHIKVIFTRNSYILSITPLIYFQPAREWRRLHNEEYYSLYRSPYVVRVIKSRILRWTGNVARMEGGRRCFKIATATPTGKRPLQGLGVDARKILE